MRRWRDAGRCGLVTFFTAGDPDLETSLAILEALPQAGADVIELGMPFTDPMADGPAIQAAGLRALNAGQNMVKTLDLVRRFRRGDDATPIVLMGYYNPIYIYGVERFLQDAVAAGVDGLIVVDLPPEEDAELCLPALAAGLNFIRLATPTTDDRRLPGGAREHVGLRLLCLHHRDHRRRGAGSGRVAAGGGADQAPHRLPVAVGFGVKDAAQRRGHRARRRGRGGRLGACRTACARVSMPPARRRPTRSLFRRRPRRRARGGRARRGAGRRRSSGLNWITNVVRPKIRSILNRRDVPDNLWIKCPDTGQLVFYKDRGGEPASSFPAPTTTCAWARRRGSSRCSTATPGSTSAFPK